MPRIDARVADVVACGCKIVLLQGKPHRKVANGNVKKAGAGRCHGPRATLGQKSPVPAGGLPPKFLLLQAVLLNLVEKLSAADP